MQIAREMSFQISAESSLTEPYIAHMLSKALTSESALFIGNSMPIRDVDMYGCSSENSSHVVDMMLSAELPCQWIQVTGNRGASGIDGLLSSATGFAVGCKKRVRFELIFFPFMREVEEVSEPFTHVFLFTMSKIKFVNW